MTTNEDLEPAGYEVMLGTRVVERNLLPAGRRFAPRRSQPLLGAAADSSWQEVLPGIMAVPDIPVTRLGELVSLSAEDLAVRRTEQVFRERQEWLDGRGSHDGS